MKTLIFSIKDLKAEVWNTPIFQQTTGIALRGWQELANDKETTIGKYPTDYALYEIGTWESEKGHLSIYPQPKSLGLANDYVNAITTLLEKKINNLPNNK